MKLHELKENVVYVGCDDGIEYVNDGTHLIDLSIDEYVYSISTLTQDFTPKKVKRTVELVRWVNVHKTGNIYYHKTKELADLYKDNNTIACVEMRGSYEVEE